MRLRVLIALGVFVAASAWCGWLLAFRKVAFGHFTHQGLVWNLVLAWVPLVLAGWLVSAYSRGRPRFELGAIGLAWLVFLPNAPYVLTDFVHLEADHRVFDSILIASFAVTSLMLGLTSLLLVQLVVSRAAGALSGWLTAFGSLFAASMGIYLGRVHRLNSWDVIHRPGHIWRLFRLRADNPLGNPHLIGYVVLFSGALALAYAGLYGLSTLVRSQRWPNR
jgi:uncharacterized membrane protein